MVTGVKSYIYTLLEEITPLVAHIHYRLEEITPLVAGVKSSIYTLQT